MNLKSEISKYLKIYQENPRSRVFAPLAEAYRKSGLVDDAIEICKEGLSYHPNFTSGLVALARSYFDKKDYTATVNELEKAISNNPDNYLAQKILAESYFNLNDYQNALKTYKILIFLEPKNYEYQKKISELELLIKQDKKVSNKNKTEKEIISNTEDEKIPELPYNYEPVYTEEVENIIVKEIDKNLDYCFEEKNLSSLFNDPVKIDDEAILKEFKTHTIAELLLEQGHKLKALEVYKEILKVNPNDLLAKDAILRLEKPKKELKEAMITNTTQINNLKKEEKIKISKEHRKEKITEKKVENIIKIDDNWLLKDDKFIKINILNNLINKITK